MKITNKIPNGKGTDKLAKNEYYALMVTDHYNKHKRPKSDYLDYDKDWIGLERTSAGSIYISKDYNKRKDLYRGVVVIVKVSKKDKVCNLNI